MHHDIRYYPPEWCSAETMAYLLDIGASTFRSYVSRGILPEGIVRGGSVRWHRQATLDAWGGNPPSNPAAKAEPANDNIDAAIIASIRRHGATAKARS
jgi:hypothetical protein